MSDFVIEVKDLVKIYKIYKGKKDRLKEALSFSKKYHEEFYALNGVSFSVKKGELIGIIGQNGSGKSTLLKILTGILSPTSGTINVEGKISALLELGAGFNMEMTGLENIYFTGTIMGFSRAEMNTKVSDIQKFADIGKFINQPVKTYSSGMFARLAFAVAINVEPEILIIDEVLSVGDLKFQLKCADRMKEMMNNGTTVLFVSHDSSSIRKLCEKAIWMNEGQIQQIGEVNQVVDAYEQFLKIKDTNSIEIEETLACNDEDDNLSSFMPNENIAEIIDILIKDVNDKEKESFSFDETMIIEVIYDVYDETIKTPVLGVALFTEDDEYFCGLSTFLDEIKIPWKYGRNRFKLKYTKGVRGLTGRYFFDAALFEEPITVIIQYKRHIKSIDIKSEYKAEGRLVLPHEWVR